MVSLYRAGLTRGTGEEANLPHHYQRFPTVLCGGVADQTRQSFDWPRGWGVKQYSGTPGPGCVSRGSPHQEDKSWTTGKLLNHSAVTQALSCVSMVLKQILSCVIGPANQYRVSEKAPRQQGHVQPYCHVGTPEEEVPQTDHHDDPCSQKLQQ